MPKTLTKRKIILIDESKCNGCGACVVKCAEGALKIIDGKARLVSDVYCDGLGACLGECPEGALTIVERDAPEFDEEAVKHHLAQESAAHEHMACGCPGSATRTLEPCQCGGTEAEAHVASSLGHWPVQLTLVPPSAPFLKGADLLLTAHCVPVAYPNFHQDFLKGRSVVIACPKLDDFEAHLKKLTEVFRVAKPKQVTVVHMEVPCCSGLVHLATQAAKLSGADIPLMEVTIGVQGEIQNG